MEKILLCSEVRKDQNGTVLHQICEKSVMETTVSFGQAFYAANTVISRYIAICSDPHLQYRPLLPHPRYSDVGGLHRRRPAVRSREEPARHRDGLPAEKKVRTTPGHA